MKVECLKGKDWVLPLDHAWMKVMRTQNVPLGSNIKSCCLCSN